MLRRRVGVFSFVRFDPAFTGERRTRRTGREVLLRSFKVMAHEIGHMFGMHHCLSYLCCMNGTNSVRELDGQPLHLCPRCLRKLEHAVRFDAVERYRRLSALYRRSGLMHEHVWMSRRLRTMGAAREAVLASRDKYPARPAVQPGEAGHSR
jgi:archaemetzincin